MAERNTAEELDDVYEIKYSTDAMTGGADKRMYLYYQLADSIKKADSVDIIVSFLMESGVKMLLGELDNALKRGAKISATDRRIARFTMFAMRNGRMIPSPRRTPSVAILIPMKMKK